MPKQKTIDSLLKTPGTIRGVLKRKKVYELADPEGQTVNLDYIKDHLLIKDNFVRDIAEMWVEVYQKMAHLKKLLLKGGPQMYEYLQKHNDIRHDSKGGFTEYDFGKNLKVQVGYTLRYDIDDSLMKQSAAHMDAWLEEHGEGDIVKVVRKAFRQRNGRYDVQALRRLQELNIADKNFRKSLELMNEAITGIPTKLRTEFYIRDENGEFKALPLNISYVEEDGIPGLSDELIDHRLNPAPETDS